MSDLKDVKTWCNELGLLPVPLFGTHTDPGAYVLLNGTRGSFCLYIDRQSQDARSEAWSANVGHSVSLLETDVVVQRWDEEPSSAKKFGISEVRTRLEGFHRDLERETPPSELSVVAHAIGVFRRLRAALQVEGSEALKAFLYLLAAAVQRVDRRTISLEDWQVPEEGRRLALTLEESIWDALLEEMLSGRSLDKLKPDLSLTLRHAPGILFQEAHYAATFDAEGQTLLPGFIPPPVTIQAHTSAIGLHFTPPALVRTIVEEVLGALAPLPASITIFDPASGSGEFLRESLRQLRLRCYSGSITLLGFDISPAACAMARFVLAWEARGVEGVAIRIVCTNALAADTVWPDHVNAVLMNPPFQSWQDMTQDWRTTVSTILGDLSKKRPDLAAAFLRKALTSLAAGGVVGAILPAPFLDGISFGGLRDELSETVATLLVARLGSHTLFHEAMVDACFYIGRRGEYDAIPLALWASHRPSSTSAALRTLRRLRSQRTSTFEPYSNEVEGFSVYPNPDIGKRGKSWAPRPLAEWQLSRRVAGLTHVNDHFTVRQGALTGLNRAFLLDKPQLLQLPERERSYFRPCVFHESLRGGRVFDEAYVFYPHGPQAIETEHGLEAAVPRFYMERLIENKDALKSREGIDPNYWWRLTRPRKWQEKPLRKLVSKYFGEAGSFAWDADGALVVVQGYSWIPRATRGFGRRVWLAYLALVNSDIFESLLAAHSNHVSGGQWNLSKRFVERIPLPALDSEQIRESRLDVELAELGAVVHSRGLDSLSTTERSKMAELSESAYLIANGGRDAKRA